MNTYIHTRCARPPRRRQRGGFSLVELLVVIAIIAILATLVLPSLTRAKDLARAVMCDGNAHQMGIALRTYVGIHKFYPGHHLTGPTVAVWPARIRTCMGGGVEAFNCPAADEEFHWRKRYGSGLPAEHGYEADEVRLSMPTSGFCYGYNDWGVREFTDPHLGLGGHCGHAVYGEVAMRRVRVPAEMIAITDSKSDYVWDTAIDPNGFEDGEWPSKRHFGHSEVAFCDGHVKRITQARLIDPIAAVRRQWNNDNKPHMDLIP